jgi:hypothetical protein
MDTSSASVQLTFANLMISQIKESLRRTRASLDREADEGYIYDYEESERATMQCEESIEFISEIW